MGYDYWSEIKVAVREWLTDNFEYVEDNVDSTHNSEEVFEFMFDKLWIEDSVTGNASGSYTCNAEQARKYVLENISLAVDAYNELSSKESFADDVWDSKWEVIDVTIRCYLLPDVIREVLNEIEKGD